MARRSEINRGRRRLLVSASALAGVSGLGLWPALARAAKLGPPTPFDFTRLVEQARQAALRPYEKPESRHGELLNQLGYEAFTGIHTRDGCALWADSDLPFTVAFFHLDQNAREAVAINVVANGSARRIDYDPSLFRYDDPDIREKLPGDLGFAGFKLFDRRSDKREWLAFKGASYFRSPGGLNQYGLSARGVAIDTGYAADEPFPRFRAYWLFKPRPGDESITICALLDGEHLTGAYRLVCRRPGDVVMDVEAHLFQRKPIRRLGIAPLTSMFWFSETNARRGADWRPEVHDSDGLAIATGDGERLWRALDNPRQPQYSAFADRNPRGFGLLQRDRVFDHYQDARVSFERRPSLWVEPKGNWGKGHIGLFELPTEAEIYDNMNAFWVPDGSDRAGRDWRFDYRLYWCAQEPFVPALARVVATRTGRAGEPGTYDEQSPFARKFVVDFEGPALMHLTDNARLQVMASASHGQIGNPYATTIGDGGRWRAFFDWRGERPTENQPVELRCSLARQDAILTETWLYSYFPEPLIAAHPLKRS